MLHLQVVLVRDVGEGVRVLHAEAEQEDVRLEEMREEREEYRCVWGGRESVRERRENKEWASERSR